MENIKRNNAANWDTVEDSRRHPGSRLRYLSFKRTTAEKKDRHWQEHHNGPGREGENFRSFPLRPCSPQNPTPNCKSNSGHQIMLLGDSHCVSKGGQSTWKDGYRVTHFRAIRCEMSSHSPSRTRSPER